MAVISDQKFSTFQDGGDVEVGDIIVGLRDGLNTKFNYDGSLPSGVIIPIAQGGTGSSSPSGARANLGLGTMSVQNANNVLITGGSWQANIIATTYGGTGVNSVTTTPTSMSFSGWDVNSNLSANSFVTGFSTTVTSGGTTVLVVGSKEIQEFTGTLTQVVTMPVVSTLVAGQSFEIINNSSSSLTINSSGGNLILSMAANTTANIVCVSTTGTTAASWNSSYFFDNGAGVLSITGTANQVIASASTGAVALSLPQSIAPTSSPSFAALTLTNPYIAGAGGLHSVQILTTGTAATYTKPANVTSIFVEVIGGGGSGGGSNGGASSNSFGGGGGAGGYASSFIASAAATYTYTVGAGGVGVVGTAGSTGGTSSFSAISCAGGVSGNSMGTIAGTASSSVVGGSGGVATGGNLVNISGQPGSGGYTALGNGLTGFGGNTNNGSGAIQKNTIGTGNNGTGFGSGGGGGLSTTVSAAGGNGGSGVIIVWEFA